MDENPYGAPQEKPNIVLRRSSPNPHNNGDDGHLGEKRNRGFL
jgi:hypothetical protein